MPLNSQITGKMNWTIRIIVFFAIYINYSVNAQDSTKYPMTTILQGDTVVVFSLAQATEMAVKNEERKACEKDVINLELQLIEKDTIIATQESKITDYNLVIDSKDIIIEQKDDLQEICEDEKKVKDKEIRKHKIGKWIGFSLAVVAATLGVIF